MVCNPILKQWKGTKVAWKRYYETLPQYVCRSKIRASRTKTRSKSQTEKEIACHWNLFFKKCITILRYLRGELKQGQGTDRRKNEQQVSCFVHRDIDRKSLQWHLASVDRSCLVAKNHIFLCSFFSLCVVLYSLGTRGVFVFACARGLQSRPQADRSWAEGRTCEKNF